MTLLSAACGIWTERVNGDLTRVGRWAERDYGFRSSQPDIQILANEYLTQAPSVIVLGDSFSASNLWQSEVSKRTGLKLVTWHYDSVPCVAQWLEQLDLIRRGSVKLVIIESVERAVVYRGREVINCNTSGAFGPPLAIQGGLQAESRSFWPLTMDPTYLFLTMAHSFQQRKWPDASLIDKAVSVPLTRSDLFSNRFSDHLLYLRSDIDGWKVSSRAAAESAQYFAQLQQALAKHGIGLLVLVIPDKSTVYRSVMLTDTLPSLRVSYSERLRILGVDAPDIQPEFSFEALHSRDFYLPNDSHLSHRGFSFLGALVAKQRSILDAKAKM